MRQVIFFIIFLLGNLICSSVIAQIGWQWSLTSSHSNFDECSLVADKSGNVITIGESFGDSITFGAITVHHLLLVIAKTDSSGNYQWVTGIQDSMVIPLKLATDDSGNLFVLGWYGTTLCNIDTFVLANPSYHTMLFLAKYSPTGNVIWAKNVAPVETIAFSRVGVDVSGAVYVTGSFNLPTISIGMTTLVNHGGDDVFIAKYDANGNYIWAQSYGSSGNDLSKAMTIFPNGDIYLSGTYSIGSSLIIGSTTLTDSLSYIAKFDSSGKFIWANNTNDSLSINAMNADAFENIYITGADKHGNVFITKYDVSGNIVWNKLVSGNNSPVAYSIAIDLCGNLWICGSMVGGPGSGAYTMNFDGHILSQAAYSYDPMFMAEYDTSGIYQKSMSFPSGADDFSDIVVDKRGNCYLGGDYLVDTMIFGHDTLFPQTLMWEASFISKYKYDTVFCNTEEPPLKSAMALSVNTIGVYPNPVSFEVTIHSDIPFSQNSKAELYDITGRLIDIYLLTGYNVVIPVSGLAPGLYQCRIITGENRMAIKKLIVMK